jgi:predicted RNA binding protein YcfA (HicA-like mRNA interferase family)
MPRLGPIRRTDLIRYLRQLGLRGPYAGGKHQIMERGTTSLRIPNPHESDIGSGLLSRILKQAGIQREEWERL